MNWIIVNKLVSSIFYYLEDDINSYEKCIEYIKEEWYYFKRFMLE